MTADGYRSLVLVVLVVLAGACAQVLMKLGVNAAGLKLAAGGGTAAGPLALLAELVRSPAIWLALVLYAGGLVVWMFALSRLPLSLAYSFQALTYLLVPLGSILLLQEHVSIARWAGIMVICLGIVIVALAQ